MKASEALLRAIASNGNEIPAVQLDQWFGELEKARLITRVIKDDKNVFYWKLTDAAIAFLKKKGVEINE